MRFGISTIDGIFPKSRRLRRPHCIVPAMMSPELRGFVRPLACPRARLRDLDGGPLLLELLLDLLRLRLGDLLLHRLGRAVHEVLGLLEAETGELADDLDHLDLLV